jgi:hypothetical protein
MMLTLTAAHVTHRNEFKQFVLNHSDSAYRPLLQVLYSHWESYLKDFFEVEMTPPYLLLASPSRAQTLGDYSPVSSFGGHSQIRIRPTLFNGEHKSLRAGEQYAEGRERFIADVLLHEMIHQYQAEVSGQTEESYKGHGPHFAEMCNRIGERLGLPRVRPAKARGKNKDLPSCAYWPHCVRPSDYYLGAFVNGPDEDENDGEGEGEETEKKEQDKRGRALLLLVEAALNFRKLWPEGTEDEALAAMPNSDAERLSALFRAVREL